MAFGKKVKLKDFKLGDLVMKENINKIDTNNEGKGKLKLNWMGPFMIIEEMGSRVYKLSSMDGK